MDIVVGWGIQV